MVRCATGALPKKQNSRHLRTWNEGTSSLAKDSRDLRELGILMCLRIALSEHRASIYSMIRSACEPYHIASPFMLDITCGTLQRCLALYVYGVGHL